MVAAVHSGVGGVAIPEFPDCCCPVFGHIAPRRISFIGGNAPSQVGTSVVAEHPQKPRDADDATRHVALVFLHDILDQASHYRLTAAVGHKAESQGQQIGRGGVVAVVAVMEEAAVERLRHSLRLHHERVSLGGESLFKGKIAKQLQDANDVGRRNKRAVGLAGRVFAMNQVEALGWHAPVAIGVFGDQPVVVAEGIDEMSNPFLDGRIAFTKRPAVAILSPQHIARERQGGRPGDVVGKVIPEQRCHIGQAAVRALCLADVAHPLGIQAFVLEEVALAQRAHRAIAEPGHALVALRTVHGHAVIIAAYAPAGVLNDAVQDGIGSCQLALGNHIVAYGEDLEVGRLHDGHPLHLHIAEAMRDECRLPPGSSRLLTAADIHILTQGGTQVVGVESRIALQPFGKAKANGVAGMA